MNTKLNLKKISWLTGVVMVSAVLVTRCGVDPTESATASATAPRTAYASASLGAAGATVARVDTAALASRKQITYVDMLARMDADLKKVDAQTQIFTRYLCLTTQYNGGAPEEKMEVYRFAMAKAVNSLSFSPKIIAPVAIDTEKTIFRIDIRDYKWRRSTWEEIAVRDPYALFTNSNTERDLRNLTQVQRLPFTRADWFIENGLQGNLYDIIMNVPGNIQTLEGQFGVNVDSDIQNGQVKRAGFNGSGVSQQSRMIEWHQSSVGSYWKSYDFKPEAGQRRRNLFEFALDIRNFGDGFDHGGGEMIFQLPNGLQMYMLTDNQGNRLETAPIDIVMDATRPAAGVTNAVSCFRCHHSGMLPMTRGDEIRKHYEANAFAYSRQELDTVRSLYPGTTDIINQLFEDNKRFATAVTALGKNPIPSINETNEPVFQLAQRFENELPLPMIAAELGMTVNDFQAQLQRSRFLSRRLGQLNTGGSIKREVFEDNFQFIVQQFGIGQVFNGRGFQLNDEETAAGLTTESAPANEVNSAAE